MIKYSIIIPTRERHRTLESSIKSALSLQRDDFEVIVSDNCSGKETEEIVKSFSDSRLVYSRSDVGLSMSANFERGLKLARGEFVTFIGDDDFIIPMAFTSIEEQLEELDVVCWFRHAYFWPDYPENPGLMVGGLEQQFTILSSLDVLKQSLRLFLNYQNLPSVYNSWIRKTVLGKIVDFNQAHNLAQYLYPQKMASPDVYSSLQILLFSESFAFASLPFSVSGISSFSNGMGFKFKNRDSKAFFKELGHKTLQDSIHESLKPLFDLEVVSDSEVTLMYIASDYCSFLETYGQLKNINVSLDDLLTSILIKVKKSVNMPSSKLDLLVDRFRLRVKFSKSFQDLTADGFHQFFRVPQTKSFSVNTLDYGVSNCCEAMNLYEAFLRDSSNIKPYKYDVSMTARVRKKISRSLLKLGSIMDN